MSFDIDAYMAYEFPVFRLPSGFEVRVYRKRDLSTFVLLGTDIPIPGEAPDLSQPPTSETFQRGLALTDRAIIEGVYDPTFHNTMDDTGKPVALPGKMHIRHLDLDDYLALSQDIFARMGATPREGVALKAFPEDAERGGDSPIEPGVPDAAPYVPAPESLGAGVRPPDDVATTGDGAGATDDAAPRQG